MIKVYQDKFSDPAKGIKGNCLRACLASLLEVRLREIPQIENDLDTLWEAARHYLEQQGLTLTFYSTAQAPTGYAIAYGDGPRGRAHACVAFNGQIVHDPYPTGGGLLVINGFAAVETLGHD